MRHVRRFMAILALLLIVLMLSSCQGKPSRTIHKVGELAYISGEVKGNTIAYHTLNGDSTIIVTLEPDPNQELRGSRFRISRDGKEYLLSGDYRQVELTFPDGRSVGKTYSGNTSSGHAGATVQVAMEEWDLVDDFRNMLYPPPKQSSRSSVSPLLGLVLFVSGSLSAAYPRSAWFLNRGWMYRNAEPSELYLGLSRVGGIVVAVIGLLVMVGWIG